MRDSVAVLAILGAIIEAISAIGGPELAGVGRLTGEHAPPMSTGGLVVGLAIAVITAVAGILVSAGRNGQVMGATLIVASIVGFAIVGPETGFYAIAAAFGLLAGLLSLLIRNRRRPT